MKILVYLLKRRHIECLQYCILGPYLIIFNIPMQSCLPNICIQNPHWSCETFFYLPTNPIQMTYFYLVRHTFLFILYIIIHRITLNLQLHFQACPYFATRALKDTADIIFCPYNYLIEPSIRTSVSIIHMASLYCIICVIQYY